MPEDEVEQQLLRRSTTRCIERNSPAPSFADGLTYEALTRYPVSRNDALTKSVEQCFYDGKGTLGQHKDSDYRNYYAASAISSIALNFDYLAPGPPSA